MYPVQRFICGKERRNLLSQEEADDLTICSHDFLCEDAGYSRICSTNLPEHLFRSGNTVVITDQRQDTCTSETLYNRCDRDCRVHGVVGVDMHIEKDSTI